MDMELRNSKGSIYIDEEVFSKYIFDQYKVNNFLDIKLPVHLDLPNKGNRTEKLRFETAHI